jgi:hypothetical protein
MTNKNEDLSNEEMEIELIKEAIEKSDKIKKMLMEQSNDIKKIISIVESFIKKKKLICYGGTAINNILPEKYKFYVKGVDIPDYDVYSKTPLEDSKELADIYAKKGFTNIEVRASINKGTYKVNVNFIPVADITLMDETTFKNMTNDAVILGDIIYAPVNYLRMSMYKELSRPNGDISRWEKVFTRLNLLNDSYPLKNDFCDNFNFNFKDENTETEIISAVDKIKEILIKNKSVFIGEFAASLYGKYMSKEHKNKLKKNTFYIEILTDDPLSDIKLIKEKIKNEYKSLKIIIREPIGHIIDTHYEITINEKTVCIIYDSKGCYNYNTIKRENKQIKVGTIDTMMTYLLASMYTGREYYNNDKLLCIAEYIFIIQIKNKLAKRGLTKRFTLDCIGYEQTLQEKRKEKIKKYRILKKNRESKEFKELFFKYNPNEDNEMKELLAEEKKKKNKTIKLLKRIKSIIKNKTKKNFIK